MMENKFFSDFAKFGNGTINAMSGLQRQIGKLVAEQVELLADKMDLATRKELDVYKQIAQKALIKVEELEKRLSILEGSAPVKKPKAK